MQVTVSQTFVMFGTFGTLNKLFLSVVVGARKFKKKSENTSKILLCQSLRPVSIKYEDSG